MDITPEMDNPMENKHAHETEAGLMYSGLGLGFIASQLRLPLAPTLGV